MHTVLLITEACWLYYCKALQSTLSKYEYCIWRKWPFIGSIQVVPLYNNTHLYTVVITLKAIMELGWEIFPHAAYSANLVPLDYHLSLSMQHSLSGQKLKVVFDVQNFIDNFIASNCFIKIEFFKNSWNIRNKKIYFIFNKYIY